MPSTVTVMLFASLSLALLIAACAPVATPDNGTQADVQQETTEQPVPPAPTEPVEPSEQPEPTEQPIDDAEANMELIEAASHGDTETVTRLLEQGADVHASNASGVTSLIAAAYQDHVEVAQLLIEAGADVNVQDNTQQSAYLITTSDGYLELLQLTLAAGADVHSLDSFNGTGLIRAADRGHVEIIEELLKTDIKIDHINRLDWTALLEAIILGDGGPRHTEVVRLLVDAGADVNLPDGNGVTPLEHARQRGYEEMEMILENAPTQ